MRMLKENPILTGVGFLVFWMLGAQFFRVFSASNVLIGAGIALLVTAVLYWLKQRPEEYVEDTWTMDLNDNS